MKNLFNILAILTITWVSAQQTPAPEQAGAITIMNATAHIGDGTVIENSVIILENGKITTVADATTARISPKGEVINAQGMHVYPGFIAPNSSLGLVEIDAVRATDDADEIGNYNPHIRSLIAYNAESRVVESMRPNGILIGQITPRGGRISGTSSIVQFDAWNWEDAAMKVDDGVHVNWPSSFRRTGWWAEPGPTLPNARYTEQVDAFTAFAKASKSYNPNNEANLKYAAMQGVFNGEKKLYIHVNGEKEIIDVLDVTADLGINNLVIVGGYSAHKVTNRLVARNIPVLVNRVHDLPSRNDEDYDLPYRMPMILMNAGVTVGLENSGGGDERFQARNFPFYAGTTAGYGLDPEKALMMITLNPAKILGIDSMVGSLEQGKHATLFISTGDALDMRGNHLVRAFIDGRDISLDTHQSQLYERYSEKLGHEIPTRN